MDDPFTVLVRHLKAGLLRAKFQHRPGVWRLLNRSHLMAYLWLLIHRYIGEQRLATTERDQLADDLAISPHYLLEVLHQLIGIELVTHEAEGGAGYSLNAHWRTPARDQSPL